MEIGGFVAMMIWIVQLPVHKCRQGFKVNDSLVVYDCAGSHCCFGSSSNTGSGFVSCNT
jgi:hypothetical protein